MEDDAAALAVCSKHDICRPTTIPSFCRTLRFPCRPAARVEAIGNTIASVGRFLAWKAHIERLRAAMQAGNDEQLAAVDEKLLGVGEVRRAEAVDTPAIPSAPPHTHTHTVHPTSTRRTLDL